MEALSQNSSRAASLSASREVPARTVGSPKAMALNYTCEGEKGGGQGKRRGWEKK